MSERIKVVIRARKILEKESSRELQWKTAEGTGSPRDKNVIWSTDSNGKRFTFDRVFGMSETNADVFNAIGRDTIISAVNGFNSTIFAYGQTGSGKTHTMLGTDEDPGLIQLAVDQIFELVSSTHGKEFLLRVSYMEIYNENVTDLLAEGEDGKKSLQVKDDAQGIVYVEGLQEVNVLDPNDIFDLMSIGESNRHFAETNMNERSSRSHTIFRIIIESSVTDEDGAGAVFVSHLNLVDLAGSERASQTGTKGTHFREGININKSLSTLGLVISKLSDNQSDHNHIPYRDSKLTRILKNSLGGNARTTIISTVNPVEGYQTRTTLDFASRAKTITQHAKVNEILDERAMMKRMKKQIEELENEVWRLRNTDSAVQLAETLREREEYIQQRENYIKEMKEQFLNLDQPVNIPEPVKKASADRRKTWCPQASRKSTRVSFGGPLVLGAMRHFSSPDHESLAPVSENQHPKFKRMENIQENERDDIDDIESSILPSASDSVFESNDNAVLQETSNLFLPDFANDDCPRSFITKRSKRRVQFQEEPITVIPGSPRVGNNSQTSESCSETPRNVLRERLHRKDETIMKLSQDFKELQEFTRLESEVRDSHHIEELDSKISSKDQEIAQLKQELAAIRKENIVLIGKLESSGEQEIELKKNVAFFQKEMDKLWEEKHQLETRCRKGDEKLATAEDKLATAENKLATAEDNLNGAHEQIVSIHDHLLKLNEELTFKDVENNRLKEDLKNVSIQLEQQNCSNCEILEAKLRKSEELKNMAVQEEQQNCLNCENLESKLRKSEDFRDVATQVEQQNCSNCKILEAKLCKSEELKNVAVQEEQHNCLNCENLALKLRKSEDLRDVAIQADQQNCSNCETLETKLHVAEEYLMHIISEREDSKDEKVVEEHEKLDCMKANFDSVLAKLNSLKNDVVPDLEMRNQHLAQSLTDAEVNVEEKVQIIKSLKQDHDLRIKSLESKLHKTEVNCVESKEALESLKHDHELEVQSLVANLEEAEAKIKVNVDMIEKLKEEHEVNIRSLRTELAQTLEKIKIVESAKKDLELKTTSLESQLAEASLINSVITGSEKDLEFKIKLLESQLAEEEAKTTDRINSLQKEYETKISMVKSQLIEAEAKASKVTVTLSAKEELESKIQMLQSQLAQAEATTSENIENIESMHQEYEKKIKMIQSQLVEAENIASKVPITESEKEKLESKIQMLQSQLAKAEATTSENIENMESMRQDYETKIKMIQSQLVEAENIASKVPITESEKEELELKIRMLESQLAKAEATTTENIKKKETLEQEIRLIKSQLLKSETIASKVTAAMAAKEDLESELAKAEAKINELNTNMEAMRQDYETKINMVQSQLDEAEDLELKISSLKCNLAETEANAAQEVKSLKESHDLEIESVISNLKKAESELQSSKQLYESTKQDLEAKIASLEAKLVTAETELAENVEVLKSTNRKLESKLNKAENDLRENDQLFKSTKQNLEFKIESLQSEALKVETELAEKIQLLKSAQLESNVQEQLSEVKSLSDELEQKRSECAEAAKEILRLREEVEAKGCVADKEAEEVLTLREELRASQEKISTLILNIERIESKMDSDMKEEGRSQTGSNETLEEKAELTNARAELAKLNEEHNVIKAQIIKLVGYLGQDYASSDIKEAVQNLQNFVRDKRIEIAGLKVNLSRAEDDLEIRIKSFNSELDKERTLVRKLKDDLRRQQQLAKSSRDPGNANVVGPSQAAANSQGAANPQGVENLQGAANPQEDRKVLTSLNTNSEKPRSKAEKFQEKLRQYENDNWMCGAGVTKETTVDLLKRRIEKLDQEREQLKRRMSDSEEACQHYQTTATKWKTRFMRLKMKVEPCQRCKEFIPVF